MKNNCTQQEILLMTGTGFASRRYSERDDTGNSKSLPGNEKLKDDCWNGLLKEILPEVFLAGGSDEKLFLWQVREANQFVALEMSEYPTGVNKYLSIDPYRFMDVLQQNS